MFEPHLVNTGKQKKKQKNFKMGYIDIYTDIFCLYDNWLNWLKSTLSMDQRPIIQFMAVLLIPNLPYSIFNEFYVCLVVFVLTC